MSVRTMAKVWDVFDGKAPDKLVLLAAADSADNEGRFVSDENQIALKCGLSAELVRHALCRLASTGWLVSIGSHGSDQILQIAVERLEEMQ